MRIRDWGVWRRIYPQIGIEEQLVEDGWRRGNDGLWRNDRFGGAYKAENAIKRIGSKRGEETR